MLIFVKSKVSRGPGFLDELFYHITLKNISDEVEDEEEENGGKYVPKSGDIFALTDVKPRREACCAAKNLIKKGPYGFG